MPDRRPARGQTVAAIDSPAEFGQIHVRRRKSSARVRRRWPTRLPGTSTLTILGRISPPMPLICTSRVGRRSLLPPGSTLSCVHFRTDVKVPAPVGSGSFDVPQSLQHFRRMGIRPSFRRAERPTYIIEGTLTFRSRAIRTSVGCEIEDRKLIGRMGIPARRLVGRERPTYIIEGTLTSFLKWTTKLSLGTRGGFGVQFFLPARSQPRARLGGRWSLICWKPWLRSSLRSLPASRSLR